MPRLLLPSELEYKGFITRLLEMGFVKLNSREEKRELIKKGISLGNAPRSQDVVDDIYVYYNFNGYRVKIRTTIRETPFYISEKDSAWIIIENEQGKAVMYAPPMHRTKNFLENVLVQSNIFQQVVKNRPLCVCTSDMNITKKDLRKFHWECTVKDTSRECNHSVNVYEHVLGFLSAKSKTYLKYKLSKENYNKKSAEKKGAVFGQAILNRKPWVKRTPKTQ